MSATDLKKLIREVPDFPKPGVQFFDLTPIFRSGTAFESTVARLAERFQGDGIDLVAGIEARGFMLAAALAYELKLGIVPVRKPGKLPWRTAGEDYELEYGTGRLEVHEDAAAEGQRILVIDDVLATGGTAAAAGRLIGRLGAQVVGYGFLIELQFLSGRDRLRSDNVFSLVQYR